MNSELDSKPTNILIQGTPRRLSAADGWSIAIVLFAVALFLLLFRRENNSQLGVEAGIFLLFALIYVPLTYVGLRASNFHGAVRYFFCLTAAPTYIVMFILSNIWLLDTFPILEKHLNQSLATGGRHAGVTQGILTAFLSAIVFWFWHRFFKLVDTAIY